MIRSSIRNGALVGKSDRPTDIGLSGALRMANQVIHGNIMMSIAGVIIPCASFRSEHAAPIVMKIEPNMNDGHQQEQQQPADVAGADRVAVAVVSAR